MEPGLSSEKKSYARKQMFDLNDLKHLTVLDCFIV